MAGANPAAPAYGEEMIPGVPRNSRHIELEEILTSLAKCNDLAVS